MGLNSADHKVRRITIRIEHSHIYYVATNRSLDERALLQDQFLSERPNVFLGDI